MSPVQENGTRSLEHTDSNDDKRRQPNKQILTFREKITSWRWMTALIVWLGFINTTLMGNSFNMALVCMTGSAPPPREDENISSARLSDDTMNSSVSLPDASRGEFDWDGATQGIILSSSLYFGFIAPAVCGFLAKKFGGKRVIGICLTVRSVIVLLTPLGARTHLYVLIGMRAIAGCVSNALSPSTQGLWSYWAPDEERVQLISASLSGVNIGSLIASLISGFLCTVPIDNGWPFVFYVFGSISILWCITWWTLVYDTPDDHPWITEKEKLYITEHIKTKPDKNVSVPYKAIVTSGPMWAYFVIQTVHKWCITVFFTYLPKYMRDVLRFPIEQNAVVSSVPFASRFIGVIFWGILSHQLAKRNVSTTANRKIVQGAGFLTCAALTAGIGFISEENRMVAVALFVITMFFQSCTLASSAVVTLDMAPRLASVITGVFQAAGNFIAIFSPITVALLTPNGTLEEWRSVFYIVIACYIFGVAVFVLFGSAEVQPWGKSPSVDNNHAVPSPNTLPETDATDKNGACANGYVSSDNDAMGCRPQGEIRIVYTDEFKSSPRSPILDVQYEFYGGENNTGEVNYGYIHDENNTTGVKGIQNNRTSRYAQNDDVKTRNEGEMNTRL